MEESIYTLKHVIISSTDLPIGPYDALMWLKAQKLSF